jgi:hypothetical protein
MLAPSDATPSIVIDEAAADHALAGLRRRGLIRSWQCADERFEVVVGRGSMRVARLDAASAVDLAAVLRRDRVTVVSRGVRVGHRWTRYRLSDGRFADRHDGRQGRYLEQYPYTVVLPGGGVCGCAADQFAAATLAEAAALAGLVRVRGRCHTCQAERPLHVERWRPDPAIPCPGCGAGPATPVTLLCYRCQKPVTRTAERGIDRIAWCHTDSGRPHCDPSVGAPVAMS